MCSSDLNNPILYRPSSDIPATESDYLGRVGIFEVLPVTEQVSHLITQKASDAEIEKVALANGMLLMKQDGYLKALAGITTIEEVLRVAEV